MRPGEHHVIPLILMSACGLWDYRCLECGRSAYLTPDQRWRHYWRIWHGRTYR